MRKSVLLSVAQLTDVIRGTSVRQKLAGAQVLHAQRVLAIAGGVDGEREQVAVVAHLEGAERVEPVALRHLVLIECDLLVARSVTPRRTKMGYCLPSSVRDEVVVVAFDGRMPWRRSA